VLDALNTGDCFNDDNLLVWNDAIKTLGLTNYAKLPGDTPIIKPIIAETNYFASQGYPQHFFVALPDGSIVDSLDGMTKKPNPYHIVSQRFLA
jgi:hypothetical protein